MAYRDKRGRHSKQISTNISNRRSRNILIEHNYWNIFNCDGDDCVNTRCNADGHINLPKHVDKSRWRVGRRYCCKCRLGPVPLTFDNVLGELKKGLGGYLYVRCQNHDCLAINRVPYGKTHRVKKKGMPCL